MDLFKLWRYQKLLKNIKDKKGNNDDDNYKEKNNNNRNKTQNNNNRNKGIPSYMKSTSSIKKNKFMVFIII